MDRAGLEELIDRAVQPDVPLRVLFAALDRYTELLRPVLDDEDPAALPTRAAAAAPTASPSPTAAATPAASRPTPTPAPTQAPNRAPEPAPASIPGMPAGLVMPVAPGPMRPTGPPAPPP